jgi:hypothetical protein
VLVQDAHTDDAHEAQSVATQAIKIARLVHLKAIKYREDSSMTAPRKPLETKTGVFFDKLLGVLGHKSKSNTPGS